MSKEKEVAAKVRQTGDESGDDPNTRRGLAAPSPYQIGEIDAVNLFNGNLTLSIPIGQSYPVGGALSYSMRLYYNSSVWEIRSDSAGNTADPNPYDNAGVGWLLSFGHLYPPSARPGDSLTNPDPFHWLLVEGDGARRKFYSTLHNGDSAVAGVSYTRDGSYLRMKELPNNEKEVESPTGISRIFRSDGQIRRIKDRFNNFLDFKYPSPDKWLLTDSQGRSHEVKLQMNPFGRLRVEYIKLAAFNGQQALYSFHYTDVQLPRPQEDKNPASSKFVDVSLLTGITLPDNSSFQMQYYQRDVLVKTDPFEPDGIITEYPGTIKSLKFPTLCRYEWHYSLYFQQNPQAPVISLGKTRGLRYKRIFDARNTLMGRWKYEPKLVVGPGPVPPPEEFGEMRTTVTNPQGDQTVHYFFNKPLDWRHGLPFTGKTALNHGGLTYFLSRQIFEGPASGGNLRRSTYIRYTADERPSTSAGNQRLEAQHTLYHDDSNRFSNSVFSEFDGLGHYRKTIRVDNFERFSPQTTVLQYNPQQRIYDYDANTGQFGDGHNFRMLAANAPWVLNTYHSQAVSEGNEVSVVQTYFNLLTGFLHRRRIWASRKWQRSAKDLLQVFTPDSSGNVVREQYYGGDNQALSTAANLATLPLPSKDVYRIDHTYQYGLRATSQYFDENSTAMPFKSLDQVIDKNTGLVKTSRDTAGLVTRYQYDTMGRLLWVRPANGHGSIIQHIYTRATSATKLANVLTHQRGNPSQQTILTRSKVTFDAFGRIWREETLMPGNVWGVRETTYNAMGWTASVSERQPGNPTQKTLFLNYDAFGRPQTIRPPDGAAHDIALSYHGTREVRKTVRIGTHRNANGTIAEQPATTIEIYDSEGRLLKVIEPSGVNGANVITEYFYEVSNRLKEVKTKVGNTTQIRNFNYDSRGFLLSEQHPENGVTQYQGYDARGHALRKIGGGQDLTYDYDRAERLLLVRETAGQRRPLKEFTYATQNARGSFQRGKLQEAVRHNYVIAPWNGANADAIVKETYKYGGRDGRISQRITDVMPFGKFDQSFVYDPLGNIVTLAYPEAIHSTGVPANRTRIIKNYRANGLLTAVKEVNSSGGVKQSFADNITYHPNGLLNRIVHANGVTYEQVNDPNSMVRPREIKVTGRTNASLGVYQYDGAGNIVEIGAEKYLYDKVSRLTQCVLGSRDQQNYTFDAFGNLNHIQTITAATGNSDNRPLPVIPTTNHLNLPGLNYDSAGNITKWANFTYSYDAFNMIYRIQDGKDDVAIIYTADDERLWTLRGNRQEGVSGLKETWTLRNLGGKVLRQFQVTGGNAPGNWSLLRDYIHRDGRLLATDSPTEGIRHYHLDHLGTPRLITDVQGRGVSGHHYFAFGQEVSDPNRDTVPLKFTGHERDALVADPTFDLDYMHARYYSQYLGRFLSVDPANTREPTKPQSWNRYSYSFNNPITYIDPDGQAAIKDFLENPRFRAIGSFGISLAVDYLAKKLPPGKARGVALLFAAGFSLEAAANSASVSISSFVVAGTTAETGVGTVLSGGMGLLSGVFAIYNFISAVELMERAIANIKEGKDPKDDPQEPKEKDSETPGKDEIVEFMKEIVKKIEIKLNAEDRINAMNDEFDRSLQGDGFGSPF